MWESTFRDSVDGAQFYVFSALITIMACESPSYSGYRYDVIMGRGNVDVRIYCQSIKHVMRAIEEMLFDGIRF